VLRCKIVAKTPNVAGLLALIVHETWLLGIPARRSSSKRTRG
jgi:hypothetical protein